MIKMVEEDIKVGKLMQISVDDIIPNKENPRMLFDPEPLKVLEESIKDVGILSPLLVYQRKSDKKLVILDGERRLICAKHLGIKKVPANIIEEPKRIENIIRMFNIHNVREAWELMPTALKLEIIIREKKVKSEKELSAITSLSIPTIQRCKVLLTYPKKYQDLMIVLNPKDRLKTDFFTELYPVLNLIEKELPVISSKFSRNNIIDIFLEKYSNKSFTNVVHFRKIANLIRAMKKGEIPKSE
jgi:ParB family chromosome partitioning protein